MHLPGPVAKRTRSKEAEFFKQCYSELKKMRVGEKSVSKDTESVSSGKDKKGNSYGSSRKKSVRKFSGSNSSRGGSGVAEKGDIDSSIREHLEFMEIDHRYEMFLSSYYDSQRNIDRKSPFPDSKEVRTNLMRENVSHNDVNNIDDDNDVNRDDYYDIDTDENFENNNFCLQPDTNLMEKGNGDGGSGACYHNDIMNYCESESSRECIIISDDDDDGCTVAVDGVANAYQASENDLEMDTSFQEEHANVRDDDNDGGDCDDGDGVSCRGTSEDDAGNLQREFHKESDWSDDDNEESCDHDVDICAISDGNSDQSEPSGMQRDIQGESVRSSDSDKSSEDTSEESIFSSEEDSVEDGDDEDYEEGKSDSDGEELSSDFEEEHLKYSKKNGRNKGEKDKDEMRKNMPLSSAFGKELSSRYKEEEEEQFVFSKKEGERHDAKKARKNVISCSTPVELESDYEKEEEEKVVVSKNNPAEKVKKHVAETVTMSGSSNSAKELRSNDEEKKEEQFEFHEINNSKRGQEDKADSKRRDNVQSNVKDACKEKSTLRNRIRAPKTTHEVVNILADSILERSEIPREEEQQPLVKPSLPLKFTFGIEESAPPEKSEEEKELDQLWAEMAIALCDTSTENNVQVDGATDDVGEVELDRDGRCDRGHHCIILDEEIGLKCKYCSFIKTESKYLTVPFCENPFGRSGTRGSFRVQLNTSEDLHYHMADNSGSTHDSDILKQGTVWDIVPGIDSGMHPHQKEGFEFLWRNIAGDIHIKKQKEESVGGESGCVISHAPGTGKTRLTISFIQTYVKQYPLCRAAIIAPCGMLPTWEAEFQKWKVDIPFHNLNSGELSGKENKLALKLASKVSSAKKGKLIRMLKLYSWAKDRSILGMSYRLFAELVGTVKNSNFQESEAEKNRKILFEQIGLMVLDEGHTARNESSLIWQALSKVHTKKRIILSGTPFQNNFDELYNIFLLARPKFAEDMPCKRHEPSKRRGRKKLEARQAWGFITDQIAREKDDGLKAQPLAQLREIIGPFVHIHKGNILQEKLPGLRDSVIVLEPCKLQKKLLVNAQIVGQRYYFGKEHIISLLSVHPSLLLDIGSALQKVSPEIEGLESILRQLRLNPEVGIKTKFLMELIRRCDSVSERVLVFSQYIDPLDFIIEQLKFQFKWSEGREVLYIHGKLDVDKRQQLIKDFNDFKSEAKVLLASIKACSEGINLVGASRVVLLDVVWNPSVERQAISRAYRLGQEKVVHIYHLITSGTMEEEKYCRQSEKDRLGDLLFDSADKADDVQKKPSNFSDEKADLILQHMRDHEKLKDMFKNIIYQPKDTNLIESFGFLDS